PDNLAGRVTLSRGDVTTALNVAPRRARMTLSIGRAGGQPMETRGLVAEYNALAGLLSRWATPLGAPKVRPLITARIGPRTCSGARCIGCASRLPPSAAASAPS